MSQLGHFELLLNNRINVSKHILSAQYSIAIRLSYCIFTFNKFFFNYNLNFTK